MSSSMNSLLQAGLDYPTAPPAGQQHFSLYSGGLWPLNGTPTLTWDLEN